LPKSANYCLDRTFPLSGRSADATGTGAPQGPEGEAALRHRREGRRPVRCGGRWSLSMPVARFDFRGGPKPDYRTCSAHGCDEQNYNDGSTQNDQPIGNLNARYGCFLAKPVHRIPLLRLDSAPFLERAPSGKTEEFSGAGIPNPRKVVGAFNFDGQALRKVDVIGDRAARSWPL
jgi:hypothetical protein